MIRVWAWATALLVASAFSAQAIEPADFTLKDIRYLPRTLTEIGEADWYALVLGDSTCPESTAALETAAAVEADAEGVQFALINVGKRDSIRQMAFHAMECGATFPALKDRDGELAQALGVEAVPAVAVLDADWALRWTGGAADLSAALAALALGADPEPGGRGACPLQLEETVTLEREVTYAKDVAPFIQQQCISCHRPGAQAPFSLTTYKRVAARAEMLTEVVQEGRMPPWYAHPEFGRFRDDPGVTDEDRAMLASWIDQGKPMGDPDEVPATPEFDDEGWRLDPDLILEASAVSGIPATGFVPYQYVFLPHQFEEDTYVQAIEIKPSNPPVVHHANLIYVREGFNVDADSDFLTGMVPGGMPSVLDGDRAWRIPAGASLALQLHLVTTGKPEINKMRVGLRFPRGVVNKRLFYHNLDGAKQIAIPPGDRAWRLADRVTLEQDVSGLGLFSHMHLRGKDMTFYAHYPSGKTETLLSLPNYSFDWQLTYRYPPETFQFPKGTTIECIAHYDNSAFNPYNPAPEKTVKEGPQTVDEMMNGFFVYTRDDEQLGLRIDPNTGYALEEVAQAPSAEEASL